MALKYFLGIDIGTSVTKGTLIREDGKVIAQEYSRVKYGSSSHTGSEHDPESVWWNEFHKITARLVKNRHAHPNDLEGIAITGMIPNITLMSKEGRPLSNSILFYDARAYDIEKRLDEELNSPRWQNEVLSKLIWLKKSMPDVWHRTYKILTTHSYIVFRLTGEYSVDKVTAIESGNVYNPQKGSWNSDILSSYGINESLFPGVFAPKDVIGYVTEAAARELGLRAGIPVVTGTGDTISSLLGAGLRLKNEMLIYYGTYNCSALLKYDIEDVASGDITSNPLEWTSTIPRSGQQLNTFAQEFFPSKSRQISLSKLDKAASRSVPGANGVVFIQTFNLPVSTVSTDPKGGLVNLSVANTMPDIARALLEAFGYGLRYSFEKLGANPQPIKSFAAGGGARSPIWKQIVSDITGLEQIYLPAADRGMGSAILAGMALRQGFLEQITDRLAKSSIVISPDFANKAKYQEMFELYCEYLEKYNR